MAFFVAGGRLESVQDKREEGNNSPNLLRPSLTVHDAVTQIVTSSLNGAFVQRHAWSVGAHGDFRIAEARQVNWRV